MKRGSINGDQLDLNKVKRTMFFYKCRITLKYVFFMLHPPFVANGSKIAYVSAAHNS
jgi:hypothetical protein